MTYGNIIYPCDPPEPVSIERTAGPERVVTNEPDPEFRPRRVGFILPTEEEP